MAIERKGFSEFTEPLTVEETDKGIAVVCNYTYHGADPNKPVACVPFDYPIEDNTLDPSKEKIALMVLNCQFKWHWKFIHWWRGIDKFIEKNGDTKIEVHCHYDTLWETIRGLFR